eukprot:117552-Prymnesium_polylepis.1
MFTPSPWSRAAPSGHGRSSGKRTPESPHCDVTTLYHGTANLKPSLLLLRAAYGRAGLSPLRSGHRPTNHVPDIRSRTSSHVGGFHHSVCYFTWHATTGAHTCLRRQHRDDESWRCRLLAAPWRARPARADRADRARHSASARPNGEAREHPASSVSLRSRSNLQTQRQTAQLQPSSRAAVVGGRRVDQHAIQREQI